MTDQELADKLVELGILHFDGEDINGGRWYGLGLFRQQAETMITDWRTAGACLVELRKRGYSWLLTTMPDGKAVMTVTSPMPNRTEWDAQVINDDDARAICEAFCEAME